MRKKITAAGLVMMLILFLLPVAMTIGGSFFHLQAEGGGLQLSLIQYEEFFADAAMQMQLRNSLIIMAGTLLVQIPVSFLGGLFLLRLRPKLRLCFLLPLLLLFLLPFQIYMVPLNQLMRWLGLYDTYWAVILWFAFSPVGPLMTFVLMEQVEKEQWEAASLDTDSMVRICFSIVLPQIIPGLMILLLFVFSEVWTAVEQPLILFRDYKLQPASLSIHDKELTGIGHTTANATIFASPVLIFYLVIWRKIRPRE